MSQALLGGLPYEGDPEPAYPVASEAGAFPQPEPTPARRDRRQSSPPRA